MQLTDECHHVVTRGMDWLLSESTRQSWGGVWEVSRESRRRGAFFRARRLAMVRMMITTTSGAPNNSSSSRMPTAPCSSGMKAGKYNMARKV